MSFSDSETSSGSGALDVVLSVVEGPRTGLRYRASGRTVISIGRSKSTDFNILDTTMSRVHAVVAMDEGGWYVEDQKSRNGLWIKGEKVARADLNHGAVFRLGKLTSVRFDLVSPRKQESAVVEVTLACARCRRDIVPESSAVRGADGRPYHIECRHLDHLVGSDLGEFKVVEAMEPLGDAFFFTAHQSTLNRTVVLEVFDTPLVSRPGYKAALLDEVRRASRFLHPNILQIYDFAEARGMSFVVMEHFRGEPLTQVLEKRRFVKIRGAISVACQILSAIQYAGEQGCVLPWITGRQVLVSESHDVKVKLFNEPSLEESPAPPADQLAYMAPEVLHGEIGDDGAGLRCVYSVSAMLYHMLAGIPPFEGPTPAEVTRRVLHESPPALRRINLKVSPTLAKIVESGINRDPEERPPTVADMLDQLNRA